jgi:hypothetical protein
MSPRSTGSCHCGAVKISFQMVDGLDSLSRCDCSICRRKYPAAVTAHTTDLRVEQGADSLALYQFGSLSAKHWFCKTCGIHTHHQRRSDPAEMGVHAGCIDGLNPRIADAAPWGDGINHPSDNV